MTISQHQSVLYAGAEEELVSCLTSGDQQDFSRLYDHYSGSLYGILLRWIKDAEIAQNLLQDVFVKAWRCRHQYCETKGRLFTWLYRIARNLFIDYYRSRNYKKQRLCVSEEDIPGLLNREAEGSMIHPDTIGVHKLLNMLRGEERDLLNMMYFKGMTQRQIAEVLDIPVGTVKTRMNKAIKELRYFFKNDWKHAMKTISLN
jgi:RNA polymerase sigma factor (sigma-70 family)